MVKAKTGDEIKVARYRAKAAKDDSDLVKYPSKEYSPLFKQLNSQFPPKNYKLED